MSTTNFQGNILLVDDSNTPLASVLGTVDLGNSAIHRSSVASAARDIPQINPQLAIVNVEPPHFDGLKVISWISQQRLPIAIIAASTDTSPSVSASAIRSGATDFLELPACAERIQQGIHRSVSSIHRDTHGGDLDHPLFDESKYGFIGAGCSMLEVSKLIINAAKSDASVFITGENGTGKDVCAQLIHKLSNRSEKSIVPLNCAAIPRGLAESEVFGHVKGSFTGAIDDREGVASLASGGTLFLDEIGEMEFELQSKLLRFVQTGRFNKVGSSKENTVDVRFICATNQDPISQIEDKTFRQDLFYRLNVIQIHLPPLRDRGDDALVFAQHFLKQFSDEEGKHFEGFSPETEKLLLSYSWPGNVRELQNVIRSIVVLHDTDIVIPSMLPMAIINEKGERRRRRDDIRRDHSGLIERLKLRQL